MKSGCIITAEVTDKGLNHVNVNRIGFSRTDNTEWVKNESETMLTKADAENYVELMVEGIMTVIYCAHDNNIKDSAQFMRETIEKLQQVFVQPANTNVVAETVGEYTTK